MNKALGAVLIILMLALVGYLTYIVFLKDSEAFQSFIKGKNAPVMTGRTAADLTNVSIRTNITSVTNIMNITDITGITDTTAITDFSYFQGYTDDERLYNKIKLSCEMADPTRAVELITDFLTDRPNSPYRNKVLLCAISIFYDRKDYATARKYIQELFRSAGIAAEDYTGAALMLGKVQRDSGVYDSVALNTMENAYNLADAVQKRELAAYLGYSYLYRKDYLMAIRYFNEAGGEYGLIGTARVYIEQGKYPEAIQIYLNYFSLYPESRNYTAMTNAFIKQCFYYAGKLKQSKSYDKAVEYFSDLANLFPNDVHADDALFSIGEIYQDTRDYHKAVIYYDKVLNNRVVSSDDKAVFNKAMILYEQDQKAEAVQMFQYLLENYPHSTLCARADDWVGLITKELQYQ